MKGTKWISFGLALGLVSASAVWTSCNKEPQPEGRTALEHAYECEDVLGPLPRFSCADAVLVPVTKNGIPLTPEQAGEGETNDPSLCDCPAAFGKACDPGFRVGRYTGLNQDGTPNEDVVFLTNCRDGGLGVIGYKFSTGETCFLHINNETTGAFDLDIPRPGEDDYNNQLAMAQCGGARQLPELPHGQSLLAFTCRRSAEESRRHDRACLCPSPATVRIPL